MSAPWTPSKMSNWMREQSGFYKFQKHASFPDGGKWVPEKLRVTLHKAPCIGNACGGLGAGVHTWHPAKTEMLSFINLGVDRKDPRRMQRMCASCALKEGYVEQRTGLSVEKEAHVTEQKAETERKLRAKEARRRAAAPLRIDPPLLPAPAPAPPAAAALLAPSPARVLAVADPAPPSPLATSRIADGALVQMSSHAARKRPVLHTTPAYPPNAGYHLG